jgi:hypothetical protein
VQTPIRMLVLALMVAVWLRTLPMVMAMEMLR